MPSEGHEALLGGEGRAQGWPYFRKNGLEQEQQGCVCCRVAQACWGRPQGLDPGVKERLQGTLRWGLVPEREAGRGQEGVTRPGTCPPGRLGRT